MNYDIKNYHQPVVQSGQFRCQTGFGFLLNMFEMSDLAPVYQQYFYHVHIFLIVFLKSSYILIFQNQKFRKVENICNQICLEKNNKVNQFSFQFQLEII